MVHTYDDEVLIRCNDRLDLSAKWKMQIWSGGDLDIHSKRNINIKSDGDINMQADGHINLQGTTLTSEQAKELYKVMNNEYKTADQRTDSWAAKLDQPFKEQEDGTFLGKASIKAAYNSAPTSPPTQFDSQNTRLPEGFQLTTGSTISIAVVLVPYEINGTGVSLRLKSVQILALVPMVAASPFDTSDGYVGEEGFPTAPPAVTNGAATGDDADELFAEPKVKAPKAEIIPATPDAKEVTNLLDKWDDE